MIIKNKSKRCIRVNRTIIKPGTNLLTKEQEVDVNSKIDFVERLIDNGVLEIPEVKSSKKKANSETADEKDVGATATSLSDVNAKSAKDLVEDTFDKGALEAFLDEEVEGKDRVSVIRAIEEQIAKVEDAQDPEDDDNDDNDDDE